MDNTLVSINLNLDDWCTIQNVFEEAALAFEELYALCDIDDEMQALTFWNFQALRLAEMIDRALMEEIN